MAEKNHETFTGVFSSPFFVDFFRPLPYSLGSGAIARTGRRIPWSPAERRTWPSAPTAWMPATRPSAHPRARRKASSYGDPMPLVPWVKKNRGHFFRWKKMWFNFGVGLICYYWLICFSFCGLFFARFWYHGHHWLPVWITFLDGISPAKFKPI